MLTLVTGDDLVFAALLLRVEQIAADRERRPARSDRPAPELDRRRCGPVSLDPHAANDAVAFGSAKAWPLDSRDARSLKTGATAIPSRGQWRARSSPRWRRGNSAVPPERRAPPAARRRFASARTPPACRGLPPQAAATAGCCRLRQESFLGSRCPPPRELRDAVAGDAVGPHERKCAAGDDERHDQRGPARSRRKTALTTAHATRASGKPGSP